MIIDCHGHQTIVPKAHLEYREAQKARLENPALPQPPKPNMSDDEIREGIEANQLKLLRERGADITIFSPRASRMEPHVGDESTSLDWSIACNDLIWRVTDLFLITSLGFVNYHKHLVALLITLLRSLKDASLNSILLGAT